MYAYHNNGLSGRVVKSDYIAKPGEQLFEVLPTAAQLATAFPDYATAAHNALAAAGRRKRDFLIVPTDRYAARKAETGQDIPLAIAAYRQALRDVPQQPGFPATIDWPTPPEI